MDLLVIVALLSLIPIGCGLVFFFRALSPGSRAKATLEECLVLSPEKYRPMERLLHEDEFRFLASQEGYSPEMGRRFRKQRRRVFRGYLRSLKHDFAGVSRALQTLIVHSAEDRGDLTAAVARQRFAFAAGLAAIELRLAFHAAGIGPIHIDARGMVDALETMQAQVRMLLMPPEASLSAL
jgi:hypothetical protein